MALDSHPSEDGIVGPETKGVVMKGRKDMALDMEPLDHKTDAKVGRFYKGCTILHSA